MVQLEKQLKSNLVKTAKKLNIQSKGLTKKQLIRKIRSKRNQSGGKSTKKSRKSGAGRKSTKKSTGKKGWNTPKDNKGSYFSLWGITNNPRTKCCICPNCGVRLWTDNTALWKWDVPFTGTWNPLKVGMALSKGKYYDTVYCRNCGVILHGLPRKHASKRLEKSIEQIKKKLKI
jgi:hypothetical protein